MRIIFMGTPDFAVPTLIELAGGGGEIVAVYTRAPKTAGRGMAERRSPVHEAAERLRLSVLHPDTLKDETAAKTFRALRADVAVVVAYGLILPKPILDAPKFGCLNLHASLLPRWRGAAPIARAIMAGDAETGISIMRMEEGLDTGPVALIERVPIAADATAGQLHDRLAGLGAARMSLALAALADDALEFKPQPESGVTYAKKIDRGETRIDWSRPWKEVHDHIRGLSPFPGAWFEIGGTRVRTLGSTQGEGAGRPGTVLDGHLTVACGEGAVRLTQVQRAGARAMSAEEFLRGASISAGAVLA
ncbi:MAG TPA: methionyl-tRNA formyltransferase [Xanthobacteraceae bacterium]|nr:methionyl-tRNA formyltransferase [Xanthobacteraceae bacterium]